MSGSRSGPPIVVFGDDWGRRVSSMQHVFREIVDRRTVVWVNGIGHRLPELRRADLRRALEKCRAMLRPAPPIEDGQGRFDGRAPRIVLQPRVLPWHHRPAVRAWNRRALLGSIREALRRAGAREPPLIVTGSPPSVIALGGLGETASVYFCMDDFSHLAGVSPRMLEPLERELLERVDAVVATARSLTRSKRPRSGLVHYLPQGVNYEHFARPRPVPAELRDLPRPVLGFAGGVSDCCDLELIRALAETYRRGSVVLVGHVTVETGPIDLPNVHVLGPRPYRELPAYVQSFDVGLIPYILNDWTRAVDPLKLLEYLAAGIPVVATPLPELAKYRDVVGIGDDPPTFLAEVTKALASDGEAGRRRGREVARSNTWRRRAGALLALLDSLATTRVADHVAASAMP